MNTGFKKGLRYIAPFLLIVFMVGILLPQYLGDSSKAATTSTTAKMQLLKVSQNKRFLVKEDGSPFFWLADTAWELFHRLTREEADKYLEDRAAKGFNVIQAVALAEIDGLETPNMYGDRPLKKNSEGRWDPTIPDTTPGNDPKNAAQYDYWDHVDYIINKAESLGLYVALLPTWGDKWYLAWGVGPQIFNEELAAAYGEWIGKRYKDKPNIIWVTGGDREVKGYNKFVNVDMATGIKKGDGGRHIITFHTTGKLSSSMYYHEENWLSFNMIQSGHTAYDFENYTLVSNDYNLKPVKPVIDAEPRYEDHPVNMKTENGWFNEYDVRQAAYWAVFSGAFGHTYGNHNIWQMKTPERAPKSSAHGTWYEALNHPGGAQMQYFRKLIESRPFLSRVPDQSLITDSLTKGDYISACRGAGYAFVYSAGGKEFTVNMDKISAGSIKAYWYNPRSGESTGIGEYPGKDKATFVPPTNGRGNDWVLILDDVSKGFGEPGVLTPDTLAPAVPSNLKLTSSTTTSVTLAWTASRDNYCDPLYSIYNGKKLVGTTYGTKFTVKGLSKGKSYTMAVKAKDAYGNSSAASRAVKVTTKKR